MYVRPVRLAVFAMLTLGCGHVTPAELRDAAPDGSAANADSNVATDALRPRTTPSFVQHYYGDGGDQQQYLASTPGNGPGRLLIMIVTYNSQAIHIESVIDNPGVSLQRAAEPLKWTTSGSAWHTEVWWGRRSQDSSSTLVTFTGKPGVFSYFYGSEFFATSIDQVVAASDMLSNAGTFSTGSRTTAFPNELVFGHGEGEGGAVLSPGSGFTSQRGGGPGAGGVLEQTKSADVPGSYEVPFSMDRSGHWLALMLTLR